MASALTVRCLRRNRWGLLVAAAIVLVALGNTRSAQPQSDQPEPTQARPESPCELETVVPQDQEELKADCKALWEFFINLDERGIMNDPDRPDAWGWYTALDDWHGVAVVNNRVEELFLLAHTGLSGSINESIPILSQLDNLRWLEIERFGSSGPIPPEIGEFSNLRILSLLGNNLSGSIPPEVGQLTNLISLNFGYNNLTGLIPPELAGLNNLEALLLHENRLEGMIPAELGQLANLRKLLLFNNNLTGVVPSEIMLLPELEELSLWGNRFTGYGSFSDDDGNIHEISIEQIARLGITLGCNPPHNDRYCPSGQVSRAQMVAFIFRALGESSNGGLAASGFSDVPDDAWYRPYLKRLMDLGVVEGYEDRTFRPHQPVTRLDMAVWLVRALPTVSPEPAPVGVFDDVPADAEHASAVEGVLAAGITRGCSVEPRLYCPSKPVFRDQMASSLVRALDYTGLVIGQQPQ